MEIVPGTALQSLTSYEERSEVVCGGVGWRRSQSVPHCTNDTNQPSGVAVVSVGAMDTHRHSPHALLHPTTTAVTTGDS